MDNPLVSIIIPVYNGSNYLKDAIDSALAQTYPNCEILVINDGSNDGGATERIALAYGDRIRYFSKQNGGVATAVNLGIKNMQGEYFAWLSHDDMYYPEKIEKQIQALRVHGDMTAVVHCNYDIFDVGLQKLWHANWLNHYSLEQLTTGNFAPIFLCIHGCSILFHKSHFERVGLYDESLIATQDSVFLFHLMRRQTSIFVEDRLFVTRMHDEQGNRTLACHEPEYNQMFETFCEMLTEKEMCVMCGSVYNFYDRLLSLLISSPKAKKIIEFLMYKMQETQVPADSLSKKHEFTSYLEKLSEGVAKNLCVFGAGKFGKKLLRDFRRRGISIDYFADNDPRKWDMLIDNVPCISFEQLKSRKEHTLVIVSMLDSDEVLKELGKNNFPYFIKKQSIDRFFYIVPPINSTDGTITKYF